MSPILGARGGLSASAYGFTSSVRVLGDYESIATTVVGAGGAPSVTFSSIPSTYKHLQIRALGQSSRASFPDGYFTRVGNGSADSGNNYSWHYLDGDGSNAIASATTSTSAARIGSISGQSATSMFTANVVDILDYANTNKYKTIRSLFGYDTNGNGSVGQRVGIYSALWQSNSAINVITIFPEVGPNFQQYSSFALYGIKG
jgi:hypothetical protein